MADDPVKYSQPWFYVPPQGGLTGTDVPVEVKDAPGPEEHNYISSLQILVLAFTVDVDFIITDGEYGNRLWKMKIPKEGIPAAPHSGSMAVNFGVPLRGSKGKPLYIQTSVPSVSGVVYVNIQGYVGP